MVNKNAPPLPTPQNNFAKDAWRCPCPKKSRLAASTNGFVCTQKSCIHANPKHQFGMVGNTPILVSPQLCDTVCDPAEITAWSPPTRRVQYHEWLVGVLVGKSKITQRNCHAFVRHLKSRSKTPKVLVIGGGKQGDMTEALWDDASITVHGVDIYHSPSVTAVCDGHYLPLADKSYDGVWIQAVLEHVVEPTRVAAEIHRVLRDNGVVYAETPFIQQVHAGAYDFTRFTVLGHRYLFHQFRLIDMGGTRGAEDALAWSLRYFVWAVTRNRKLFTLAFGFAVLLRPFGMLVSKKSLYDSPSGVYFMGSKSNKLEVTHKQLLTLYQGNYQSP